jgi:hypothetical protein
LRQAVEGAKLANEVAMRLKGEIRRPSVPERMIKRAGR